VGTAAGKAPCVSILLNRGCLNLFRGREFRGREFRGRCLRHAAFRLATLQTDCG
jgi:hypothetical protein